MEYEIKLGNVEMRKGHRHDCGQVSVVIRIEANSEKEARKKVAGGQGRIVRHTVGLPTVIDSALITRLV